MARAREGAGEPGQVGGAGGGGAGRWAGPAGGGADGGRGRRSTQPRSRELKLSVALRVSRVQRSGRHESCSGGTRLFASGAVAAAVQLRVSREHRAAGPAGQDR